MLHHPAKILGRKFAIKFYANVPSEIRAFTPLQKN